MKHGFIAVGSSGLIIKLEVPPVINDTLNKNILSAPGSKIVWTPEAITYLSNISSGPGDVIAVKTKTERYLQDSNVPGQQATNQIEIDTVINAKPGVNLIYSTPVVSECDPHFHSAFRVQFHPVRE